MKTKTKLKAVGFRVKTAAYESFVKIHKQRIEDGEIASTTSLSNAVEMLIIKDNAARSV